MIYVTRRNGPRFAVNPDLLLRADATPDTILTFIDGTKLIVTESLEQVITAVHENRAQLLARAQDIQFEASTAAAREQQLQGQPPQARPHGPGTVTPLHPQGV